MVGLHLWFVSLMVGVCEGEVRGEQELMGCEKNKNPHLVVVGKKHSVSVIFCSKSNKDIQVCDILSKINKNVLRSMH